MTRLIAAVLLCALASSAAKGTSDHSASKPNVRAITAFVRLDQSSYEKQIDQALAVLNAAKAEFAKRGYETQILRIVPRAPALIKRG
jgi:hypothetical protein